MTTHLQNFINGQRTDAGDDGTLDIIDPSTGEVYATSAVSTARDVGRAYEAAAEAFESWGETTPSERQRALFRIADALTERAAEFAAVESRDTGKPLKNLIEDE